MRCSEEVLVCRIFEQAIEDYRGLKQKNITQNKDNSGAYSTKDIECFFNGKWCTRLLEMIGSEATGKDILHRIQSQCVIGGDAI